MGESFCRFLPEYPGWEQLYVESETQCHSPCIYKCGRGGRRYRYPALDADERDAKEIQAAQVSAPVFLVSLLPVVHLLDLRAGLPEIFQEQGGRHAIEEDGAGRSFCFLGVQTVPCFPVCCAADLCDRVLELGHRVCNFYLRCGVCIEPGVPIGAYGGTYCFSEG